MKCCPVCHRAQLQMILQVPDPLSSNSRSFEVVRCVDCGLVHTAPALSPEELDSYYISDYWREEVSDTNQPPSGLVRNLEQWFVDYRMGLTMGPLSKRVPPGGRVLDIGCGSGEMLGLLVAAGYETYGMEVSGHAAQLARRVHGAEVFHGTLEDAAYPEGFFDAVTLFHVLEHLQNPMDALKEIHRILKPGGLVLIEVPNVESLGFRLFTTKWQPLQIPFHLYHFSPDSLGSLLSKQGFQVVGVSHFSPRASCAAWVLSMLPFLAPRNLRKRAMRGQRTTLLKILYFALQMLALPLAVGSALLRRGDVIRASAIRQ